MLASYIVLAMKYYQYFMYQIFFFIIPNIYKQIFFR